MHTESTERKQREITSRENPWYQREQREETQRNNETTKIKRKPMDTNRHLRENQRNQRENREKTERKHREKTKRKAMGIKGK